jgi:hypothetical protein
VIVVVDFHGEIVTAAGQFLARYFVEGRANYLNEFVLLSLLALQRAQIFVESKKENAMTVECELALIFAHFVSFRLPLLPFVPFELFRPLLV